MGTEAPPICMSCGQDVPRRARDICARCGAETKQARLVHVPGSKPPRFELQGEPGSTGVVTMNGRRVATARGHRHVVWLLRAPDVPPAFEHLTSRRLVAFPLDLEVGADLHEIAAGAFVCAVLGLARRGAIDLSFDDWVGWERNGPFVVPVPFETACHVQLRLAAPQAGEVAPLEALLLETVSDASRSHGYRSRAPEWCALDHVLHVARDKMPSKRRIAQEATFSGFEFEHALEAVTTAYPRLVGALVAASKCLPP